MVKDLEGENENLLDEAGTKEACSPEPSLACRQHRDDDASWSQGDASSAARRAKAELEIKCRELEDQVCQPSYSQSYIIRLLDDVPRCRWTSIRSIWSTQRMRWMRSPSRRIASSPRRIRLKETCMFCCVKLAIYSCVRLSGKLQDTEGRCRSLEESVQQKESELRIYTKTAGDDAMGEVTSCGQSRKKTRIGPHSVVGTFSTC